MSIKKRGVFILTPRRMEIIRLIDRKMSKRAIAKQLGIDDYTVRDHLRVLRRIGIVGVGDPDGRRKVDRRRLSVGRRITVKAN